MNTDRVELSAFVTDRIAHYRTESAENRLWLAPYVAKYNILPLLINWTETTGITPDGAIRKFSADGDYSEYEGLRTVDAQLFFGALVQGARKYPELRSLIPARPHDAKTCESCRGLGLYPPDLDIVCECGGVGWRMPDGRPFNSDAAEAVIHPLMYSRRTRLFVRLFYTHAVSILIFTAFVLFDWIFVMGILPIPNGKIVAYAFAILIAFLIAPKVARYIR